VHLVEAVVQGVLLAGAAVALAALAVLSGIACVVGLVTGNRRLSLAGATVAGGSLVLAAMARVAVARAGLNRAEQGVELATEAGGVVVDDATEAAVAAGDQAQDAIEQAGQEATRCLPRRAGSRRERLPARQLAQRAGRAVRARDLPSPGHVAIDQAAGRIWFARWDTTPLR
jgi:hypothetical protein